MEAAVAEMTDEERAQREQGENPEPVAEHEGPLEGESPDEQREPEMILEGEKTLNHRVGGTVPTVCSATLKTKTVPVPGGQYEKDDEIYVMCRLRCCNVSFPDKRQGGALFTERKHDFEIVSLEKVPK